MIPDYRLFAAADALMEWDTEQAALAWINRAPDRAAQAKPDPSDPFTQSELLEAMAFLKRGGWFQRRATKIERAVGT